MDNITNGLYIYHISIIGIFIVVWNICVFFASYIDIYILIGWFIIGLARSGPVRALKSVRTLWESNMESWEIPPKNGGFHWKKTWMCWFSWFSWFSTPRNDQSKVSNWFYMGAWPPESRVVCYAFGQDLKPELLEPVWVCLKMRCTSKMAMFMGTLISN